MSEQTPPLNPFWVAPLRTDPARVKRLAKKAEKLKPNPKPIERKPEEDHGLSCPQCGCAGSEVLSTRPTILSKVWRRRECLHCGHRFTTTEKVVGKRPIDTGSTRPRKVE